ncbi:MAG: hypothetical protein ACERKK_04080 [Poseidonibacter sp.]|uniref:hypothetical protein n=1 Tax=Poseidonibacter sp. TaxID=2321188 RepID=UPI00359E4654
MAKTIGVGAGRRYTEKMAGATIAGVSFNFLDGQVSANVNNTATTKDVVTAKTGTSTDAMQQVLIL